MEKWMNIRDHKYPERSEVRGRKAEPAAVGGRRLEAED